MNNLELRALFHCIAEHQEPPVPWVWRASVCYNLSELYANDFITMEQVNNVERLMVKWAGHETGYPVPGSPDALHGRELDDVQVDIACFWKWEGDADMYTGTYGRSRREMCLFIARNI